MEEVDLQIRLLLEPLELLHAQLVQFDPSGGRHGSRASLARLVTAAPGEERRRL